MQQQQIPITFLSLSLSVEYIAPYGSYLIEGNLHKMFAHLKSRGEWYHYDESIKQLIEQFKALNEEIGLAWDLKAKTIKSW